MLNERIFKENFLLMCEIYEKQFSDGVVNLYYEICKDMLDEQFSKSVKKILSERVFANFPKPAEFREMIFGNKDEQLRVKTTEALSKFKEAIKKCCSVAFDDPYIHKTIKLMGGWNDILMRNKEQINWIEKEFCEKYEDLIKRQPKIDDIDKVLYTKRDLLQLENGLTILEPIKIGDKIKVEKWQNALESKKQGVLVEKIY